MIYRKAGPLKKKKKTPRQNKTNTKTTKTVKKNNVWVSHYYFLHQTIKPKCEFKDINWALHFLRETLMVKERSKFKP